MFAGKGFSSPGLVAGALLYQGAIDCSGNPNYPAADAGYMYIVSVAGKIGGASGLVVSAGDSIVCTTDLTPAGTQAAVGSYWNIIQANIDLTNISVTGGTINGTTIGGTTQAAGTFSPLKAKGPAAITSFAGTVSTSGSSTTVTFSSAADAILAGYSATNPILGTTLIAAGPFTRYIVSWTNSTTCVVDSAVTLGAGTAITSVQLPSITFVNSAGVTQGWINAAGGVYFVGGLTAATVGAGSNRSTFGEVLVGNGSTTLYIAGNVYPASGNFINVVGGFTLSQGLGVGTSTFGTSAAKVLAMGVGTAPTTSPASAAQLWVADYLGAADDARWHFMSEKSTNTVIIGDGSIVATGEVVDTHYDTIFIPASAMTPTATNGAVGSTAEYATNDINMNYLLFDGATEQYAEFQIPMPENWDRSTVKAKFYWSSDTGSTTNDTVEWEIAGGALSDSDVIDAALGTAQVISDVLLADNGTDLQISGATPALTVGGTPALGDLVHFKVSRNVGGTDDMTENARLFGVWIQYKATLSVAGW